MAQQSSIIHERILQTLKTNGYRLTRPRQVIVEAIEQFERAFTAEELLVDVERRDPDVGRATVFRTLDVLSQVGALDRIHGPDGCHSYVLISDSGPHYHLLICSSCGSVIPFEACNVEDLYPRLSAQTNFAISGHMLEVFGLCDSCQA